MLKDDEPYYLSRKRQIRELSDFGYEIFWKEWGHQEIPAIMIPPFITNFKLLHRRLNLMIDTFIGSIEILDSETRVAIKKKEYKVLRHKKASLKSSYRNFHPFDR